MRILVSNDDGYRSAGIRALASALAEFGDIIIVAPEMNRSGASNSLTLDSPLRMVETEEGVFFVNGTPTDCVHLAITGLMDPDPDMVVSGINDGANLGDDVLYSGTVAAAMEGRCLGLPAIAWAKVTCAICDFESGSPLVCSGVLSPSGNRKISSHCSTIRSSETN